MVNLLELREKITEQNGIIPSEEEWAKLANISIDNLRKILKNGEKAKKQMILANLKLVVYVAKKYQNQGIDLEDLIQEGSIGLKKAVERFDPQKGYKFSTYAFWWIRQAMLRTIRNDSNVIRIPIHVTEKIHKIKKLQKNYHQKNGTYATNEIIAKELNCQPNKLEQYIYSKQKTISINKLISTEQETELQEFLEDQRESPEKYSENNELHELLEEMLSSLPPIEQTVLKLHFGWHNNKLSLSQISKKLNIPYEKIREINKNALKKLSQYKDKVHEYL